MTDCNDERNLRYCDRLGSIMVNGQTLPSNGMSNNTGNDRDAHENGNNVDNNSAEDNDELQLPDEEALPETQTAKRLKSSLRGINTDETVIINTLATTSNADLQQIKSKYAELFDSELEEDLSAEIGGFFEELCLILLQTPLQNEIETAHKALQRGPRQCHQLVEILMLKEEQQNVAEFKTAYHVYYGKKIDYVVKDRLKGQMRSFVLWLLNGGREGTRSSGDNIDEVQAFDDAARLMSQLDEEYSEKVRALPPSIVSLPSTESVDNEDDALFELLSVRTPTHLQFVFQHFEQLTEKSIEVSVTDYFRRRPSQMRKGLIRADTQAKIAVPRRHHSVEEDNLEELIKCLSIAIKIVRQGALSYFVDQIHECFSPSSAMSPPPAHMGIDDDTIMRLFAQRKEIDLALISAQYSVKYPQSSLMDQIKQNCFGDYGKLLQVVLLTAQGNSVPKCQES